VKLLALSGWLVAAAALYMARYSLALAIESAAEAREAQLIACQAVRLEGRLLGWETDDQCSKKWMSLSEWPPAP
jgi:hypothetical protein